MNSRYINSSSILNALIQMDIQTEKNAVDKEPHSINPHLAPSGHCLQYHSLGEVVWLVAKNSSLSHRSANTQGSVAVPVKRVQKRVC